MLKQVLLFVILIFCYGVTNAQSSLWNQVEKKEFKTVHKEYKGLQKVYKKLFSSQDGDVCEFELSCSSYSRLCFAKYSFFQALFLTFDRLSRCNGSEAERYYERAESGKLIDIPR
ncbi:MAG: membrane protein insertion efficiency factor YidD [Bacteroidia bacterium]